MLSRLSSPLRRAAPRVMVGLFFVRDVATILYRNASGADDDGVRQVQVEWQPFACEKPHLLVISNSHLARGFIKPRHSNELQQ